MFYKFTSSNGQALHLKLSSIYCVESCLEKSFVKGVTVQGTKLYVGNDTHRCFLVKEDLDDILKILESR